MKALVRTATLLGIAALFAFAQNPNEDRDRGATRNSSPSLGALPTVTVAGTLVDAGCRNRSALNMSLPGVPFSAALPAETKTEAQAASQMRAGQGYANANQPAQQQNPSTSASGITVDSKTLASERPDVLEHQVPDLHTRQMDPTCAITGATHGFAVVTSDGRMLNLDDGGDTYATVAIQASAAGKAMMEGNTGGIKPQVTIKGHMRGDKIVVQSLKLNK